MPARIFTGENSAPCQGTHTNTVERAISPITLGRKNHLFAGSDGGAGRWAVIATTAKLNDVEPYAYLKDVLERTAGVHPMSRLDELLP